MQNKHEENIILKCFLQKQFISFKEISQPNAEFKKRLHLMKQKTYFLKSKYIHDHFVFMLCMRFFIYLDKYPNILLYFKPQAVSLLNVIYSGIIL